MIRKSLASFIPSFLFGRRTHRLAQARESQTGSRSLPGDTCSGLPAAASGFGKIRPHSGLLLIPVALSLSGCGQGETTVQQGNRDQILHMNLGAEPEELDPHLVTSVAAFDVLRAIQEGLVSEDPSDLSPVPGVAERWEISDDKLEYTFFLRDDARWSNGDPVTASDFLFSYERMLSPALGAKYAEMLYCVANARAFNKGEIDDFSQVGFKVVDEGTIQIRLAYPTPFFLSLLTNAPWWPVHPPTILKHGRMDQLATGWTRAESFVGNGPFMLSEWRTGRAIRVERNPHYWDAESVQLNGIVFYPIESPDTEERAFRSGQLHVTKNMPPDRIDNYLANNPELIRSEPYLGVYFFRLNVEHEPFRDARVRRAISLAIDQEALVRDVLHGHFDPAFSFTPPVDDYRSRATIGFDLDRARELMAEAGYPNGDGFPPFDLLFNTQEVHRRVAEAVQQMLRTNLNLQVNLYNQEFQSYLASVSSMNYHSARASWIGDYPDPNTFLELWITGGGNNNTGWSNPDYDRLIDQAARAGYQEERYQFFQEAEAILLEESPVIPIYHFRNNYLIRPSLKNWHSNILNRQSYQHLYLDPEGE